MPKNSKATATWFKHLLLQVSLVLFVNTDSLLVLVLRTSYIRKLTDEDFRWYSISSTTRIRNNCFSFICLQLDTQRFIKPLSRLCIDNVSIFHLIFSTLHSRWNCIKPLVIWTQFDWKTESWLLIISELEEKISCRSFNWLSSQTSQSFSYKNSSLIISSTMHEKEPLFKSLSFRFQSLSTSLRSSSCSWSVQHIWLSNFRRVGDQLNWY